MCTVTHDNVTNKLRTVLDPELHKDLVSLNMIKDVILDGNRVTVHIELTTPACPLKEQIGKDVKNAVNGLSGVSNVDVEFSARVTGQKRGPSSLPNVKNVVAVGAGKGGVGKSTAAALLAIALRRMGATVGLMDADVYGPSIPTMLGVADQKPRVEGNNIIPIEACGIRLMSIGFMVERHQVLM